MYSVTYTCRCERRTQHAGALPLYCLYHRNPALYFHTASAPRVSPFPPVPRKDTMLSEDTLTYDMLLQQKAGTAKGMGTNTVVAPTLDEIQQQQKAWLDYNFPGEPDYYQLLGIMEEGGELCHAALKRMQGIRGTAAEHTAAERDALGDILIYLLGYCNRRGYSAQEILTETWTLVSKRNWQKNKQDGGESAV